MAAMLLAVTYDFVTELNQNVAAARNGLNTNASSTALQRHVLLWDRNSDGIISTKEVYTGFRSLGFSIPFSLGGFLINVFFSYATPLAHSYLPDPFFHIHVDSIHRAKHGSDTGTDDSDGHLRLPLFDEMFEKLDSSGTGNLGVGDLFALFKRDRVAADPAGWSFAFMEWWTTWLLLQRDGRV
jgi:peroxygenase